MKKILFVLILLCSFSAMAGWNKHTVNEKRVLFEIGNSNADVSVGTLGAHELFEMPAKTTVLGVSAYVETAITGGTMVVGDATDPDGYLLSGFEAAAGFYPIKNATAATTKAGAYIVATEGSTAVELVGGKYYSTATDMNLTIGGSAITAGKVWFIIKFMVH